MLAELRRTLGSTGAAAGLPPEPPPPQKSGPVPLGGSVADMVGWLAAEVRLRAGIAVNEQVKSKIMAIAERCSREELNTWTQKLAASDATSPDWLSFVEMLTVHETYFLRDPGQLDFVRRTALGEIIARAKAQGRPSVQIWSAACSTGEEAYSLAFLVIEALCERGEAEFDATGRLRLNAPWRIEVLGTDLSRQAVRTANEGVYRDFGLGAFRSLPPGFWKYFVRERLEEPTPIPGDCWRVRPEIKQMVRFGQFNLMNRDPPASGFDVVLCRNVLIYFDQPGKRQVFQLIHRALRPQGYAVFGPTDIPDDPTLFETQWGPATVIYRKK